MSDTNGQHPEEELLINDNTIRYLHTMVDILGDPAEFDALLTTIKASTRGKESTEMHTRIRGVHYTVINAANVALLAKWETVLHEYLQRTAKRGEPVDMERFDWLMETNQASIVAERAAIEQMETADA